MRRILSHREVRYLAIACVVVGVLGALAIRYATRNVAVGACLEVAKTEPDDVVVLVCARAYRQTGAPTAGAKYANALRRTGSSGEASRLAHSLLAGPARADALQVLGR